MGRLGQLPDGSYVFLDENGTPIGKPMKDKPSKESLNKEMSRAYSSPEKGAGMNQAEADDLAARGFKTRDESPEAYSKRYKRPTQSVFDTILRNVRNQGRGTWQMLGLTNPSEDEAAYRKEQQDSNLTSWPTAIGAVGAEMFTPAATVGATRRAITGANNAYQAKRLADPLSVSSPTERGIKSISDALEYKGDFVVPTGMGGAFYGGLLGGTSPLSPEEMEDEWTNRGKNLAGGAIGGKALDLLMTGGSAVNAIRKARKKEKMLIGNKGEDGTNTALLPEHIVNQDPDLARNWESAKTGKYGDAPKAAVFSSEQRSQQLLEDNVNRFRSSIAGNPAARKASGYQDVDPNIKGFKPSLEAGGGWSKPLYQLRTDARRLKRLSSNKYEESKKLGDIRGYKSKLSSMIDESKQKLSDEYLQTDIPIAVKSTFKELDNLLKGDEVEFNVRALQGLIKKLNRSYKDPGDEGAKAINLGIRRMTKSLDEMVGGTAEIGDPRAITSWNEGRKLHSEYMNKYQNDDYVRMMVDSDSRPEDIARSLFPREEFGSGGNRKDRADGIDKALEVAPYLKPYFKQDLFNSIATGNSPNEIFASTEFIKNFGRGANRNESGSIMRSVFNEDELGSLKEIYKSSKLKNTDFNHKDFKAGVAPGIKTTYLNRNMRPEFLTPEFVKNYKEGAKIMASTLGATPTNRSYALPAGIGADILPRAEMFTTEERKKDEKDYGKLRQSLFDYIMRDPMEQ